MSWFPAGTNGWRSTDDVKPSKYSSEKVEKSNSSPVFIDSLRVGVASENAKQDGSEESSSATFSEGSCGGTILESVTSENKPRRGSTVERMDIDRHSRGPKLQNIHTSFPFAQQGSSVPSEVVFADNITGQPSSFNGCEDGAANARNAQPVKATVQLSDMSTVPSEYNEAAAASDSKRLTLNLSFTPSMVQRNFAGKGESREPQFDEDCCHTTKTSPKAIDKVKSAPITCTARGSQGRLCTEVDVAIRQYKLFNLLNLCLAIAAGIAAVCLNSESTKHATTVTILQGKLDHQNQIIRELTNQIEKFKHDSDLLKKVTEDLNRSEKNNEGLKEEVRRLKTEAARAVLVSHASMSKLREKMQTLCVQEDRDLLVKVLETTQRTPHANNIVYWDILVKVLGVFAQPAACYFFNACPVSQAK
mmetsp:Transcript_62460/g.184776  ORF Transcript_62460/g.184776 Transcript_62460/m.184776 type:complete len:418 (-) Transcript_62460:204-1457(-)